MLFYFYQCAKEVYRRQTAVLTEYSACIIASSRQTILNNELQQGFRAVFVKKCANFMSCSEFIKHFLVPQCDYKWQENK